MSRPDIGAEELTLPIKRTEGDTMADRLTANAYNNILPARYLRKDADGNLIEDPEELFPRVAKNIALAEAAFEAENRDEPVTVTPDQVKPDHPRRDELAAEVFGAGTTVDDDVETALTPDNVNKFAYDTVVPALPEDVAAHVRSVREEFEEMMGHLDFMPNSPTLMNAGDELQQLSACFVDSPADDIDDIHETAKEAAQVFQSGGGMGYAFWQLRPYGDTVGSTGGIASGPITFMRTFDQMCFVPGTKVLTPDGHVPIEELETDQLVVDENGDPRAVTETMERSVDEEIVEVTPERLNKSLRVTAEHPFKVVRDDGFEWVDAGDLTEDDLLVLGHSNTESEVSADGTIDLTETASGPLVFADGGVKINREYYGAVKGTTPDSFARDVPVDDFATVAGWYLAEGSIRYQRGVPSTVTFTLNSDEREAAAEIRDALDSFEVPSRVRVVEDRNTLHVHVEHSSFAQFVESQFGTGAAEKTVPDVLWQASPAVQARVLETLFEGDGRVETRGQSQRAQLKLANEEIVDFVFQAGLRCGVQFSRHDREPENRKPTYSVSASVSTALGTPLERLFTDVPEDFSPRDRTKQANGREVVAVDSIERSHYEGPVYNAEVAGTHTYVAEDIVVHNCETIAQGGTRRGAQMGVMRVSHPDVIQFIHAKNKDVSLATTLKLNDPSDYTHTSFKDALEEARELIDEEGKVPKHLRNAVEGHLSNFNISVGVTDDFMAALAAGEEFTFTNPRTGEPHVATEHTREMYEWFGLGDHVEVGEELSLPAEVVWERIVEGAHENGEPGVIYLERVNKQHSFDVEEHPDHRILATNPCVTGDTYIDLADERHAVQIEELYYSGEAPEVWTLTESGEWVTNQAQVLKTGEDESVISVKFEEEVELTVTPDHEVRMASGEWVEAQNLSPGDRVEIRAKTSSSDRYPIAADGGEVGIRVKATEDAGTADVFDLRVPGTNNYFAATSPGSDVSDVFVNVHNCGEQPLEEYEACNLGHINLSTLADADAPDWRVWSDRHAGEYDSFEAAVDAYLEEAIDVEELDRRIEYGTRFLENVVTMSDFPVEEISETVREMRKIGLGVMGLAQLYIQLGVKYGSEEGNEMARQLMRHINHGSKATSHELAADRGVFAEWDNSKYAAPTEYPEWFEHHTGEDPQEWAEGYPIRNHNTTTIAPTGTTSMIGNTSGGCEPIYNVAYYKNVGEDVQGEEMLVEFDDYFLRTLEANDIDVDAVKEEAQRQMAANEFDGVEGLETVPDAIAELFVTTQDLTAKEHAAVQCACQEGVDSAISKTVNAPNGDSVADAQEVFEYVYEHGGKGVTYYRDGTRSKQVLTTRADNTEFADEAEAAEQLVAQIEEVFGGVEAFVESDEVRAVLDQEVENLLASVDERVDYAEKRPRPDALRGVSQRIETGYGRLYVTINEDPETGEPFELFANIGHSGGFTNSFTEALAKVISTALRSGVDPHEVVDELCGTRSPKVAWDKGEQIQSIPDAIGTALRRYLEDEVDKAYPEQTTLDETAEGDADAAVEPEPDGGAASEASGASSDSRSDGGATTAGGDGPAAADRDDATRDLIENGESPECPECGSMQLYYAEGCKTCEGCGWSEC